MHTYQRTDLQHHLDTLTSVCWWRKVEIGTGLPQKLILVRSLVKVIVSVSKPMILHEPSTTCAPYTIPHSQLTLPSQHHAFEPLLQDLVRLIRCMPQSPMRSRDFSSRQIRHSFLHVPRHGLRQDAISSSKNVQSRLLDVVATVGR